MKFLTTFSVSLLICLALLFLLPLSGEEAVYSQTLRLHILANSDSEEDQRLKLEVRDAVLTEVERLTADCKSADQARQAVAQSSSYLECTAEKVIKNAGYDYTAKLIIGDEYYPKRSYNDVTLPAGTYCSVRIAIGEAQGQNWWCILFPPLCTQAAEKQEEELVEAGFTPDQIKILTESESPRYVLKFRFLEILEEILARFKGE